MERIFQKPNAIAFLKGGSDTPTVFGRVEFYQKAHCVLVVADVGGLPKTEEGFYGFHIHEGKSCEGENFSESKSHYNPEGRSHPEHAGDLPPLLLCGKIAYLSVLTCRFKIEDIIGKTVIIHSMPDDFKTQPSGDAGKKIACGIIKKT